MGSVRTVVATPDPVLAQPANEVDPTDAATVQLADDLVETMRVSPGCVGLAATQIGVASRVFCLDVTGHKKAVSVAGLVVLVNPRLVAAADFASGREGCMSVPDFTGDVARATRITVRGFAPGTGEELTYESDAFEARAFQHELDHLDGLLFLNRVSGAHAIYPRKRYL